MAVPCIGKGADPAYRLPSAAWVRRGHQTSLFKQSKEFGKTYNCA
jgi:hypothetical protein